MKRKKNFLKKKKRKKEYIWVTLLVELSQTTIEGFSHKSFIPSQFKSPFDSKELYQSIKICWSLGSVKFWPISKKNKKIKDDNKDKKKIKNKKKKINKERKIICSQNKEKERNRMRVEIVSKRKESQE